MLSAAIWVLGGVVLAGLGLSCFHLAGWPVRGWARWGSWGHGLLGLLGVVLTLLVVAGAATDPQGFGRLTAGFLACALLGGLLVLVAQLRHRRPAGVVVAVHAVLGVAGYVLLAAYVSMH